MIKLYGFGSGFDVVDPSPFVLKIDAFMRMANIEYQSKPSLGNLQKAPKGKLPFIRDGEKTVADSEFIITYLQEKFQIMLDAHLSDEQKSLAYLMGKSLDENLYWCLVHSRWANDESWVHVKKEFFDSIPFPLKFIVPIVARKGVISALKKQGLSSHSNEEIAVIAQRSLSSLSTILGQQAYFFGDEPSTFDATAFGILSQFIHTSLDNQLNRLARDYDNLVDYCNRIRNKYY